MSIIFISKFKPPKLEVRDIVYIGMLMALSFIISKFSINTQFISISPAFIITAIIGISYGPVWGASVAGISDILFYFYQRSNVLSWIYYISNINRLLIWYVFI
ncbi:ECF transporter S component [Apilactobacillus ozensis]|uniref:ECF transporter S component n=1 Tax=Apilactobacillus ozensis TaxID=866801 RepID=UPI0006D1AADC